MLTSAKPGKDICIVFITHIIRIRALERYWDRRNTGSGEPA